MTLQGLGSRLLRVLPLLVAGLCLVFPEVALAQDPLGDGALDIAQEVRDMPVATSVRIVVLLTALTFLPAILLVMTPFTRFVIVFSLLRQAMGLQQSPPNQVIVGLALMMSMLILGPELDQVRDNSIDPYVAGEITTEEAYAEFITPLRGYMLRNTRRSDMAVVLEMGRMDRPSTLEEIPTSAVVSAYVLSELKTAFVIAVKVYLPFLVLDIIIANILLAMGMMVLPPVIISLPFKILLFVLMDGWNLLVRSMSAGFG